MSKRKRKPQPHQSANEEIQRQIKDLTNKVKTAIQQQATSFIDPQVYQSQLDDILVNYQMTLVKQYSDQLIQHGYGMTREAIEKLNIIDVRNLYPKRHRQSGNEMPPITDGNGEYLIWGKNHYWISSIPCFETGAIRLNDDRYIYWNIQNINMEENSMELKLFQYIGGKDWWEPGVSTEYKLIFHPTDVNATKCEKNDTNYVDIYKMVSYKKLQWNSMDIQYWEKYVVQNAQNVLQEFHRKGTDPGEQLIKLFSTIILKVNYELAMNKVSHPKTVKTTEPTIELVENKERPTKIVRTIGKLKVSSEKPPKSPTRRTIIRYSVASWPTKGHIRTYKSGKQVYIKPTVHHRKAFQKDDKTTLPQTILQFKKQEPQ